MTKASMSSMKNEKKTTKKPKKEYNSIQSLRDRYKDMTKSGSGSN